MLKNIGSNWALNVVQILVFMALTTFVVNVLGAERFGTWESILAAAGPLQLLILGVPMAAVRAVSAHLARGEEEDANRVLGTCVSITIVMGGATLAAGALVFAGFDAALLQSERWGLDAGRLADARTAYWIFLANLALGFCLRLPYAVYDAHHDFIARNLVMTGGFLLKLALTVVLLSLATSLTTLAWVQLIVAAAEFAVAYRLSRARHPRVRFRPGRLDRRRVVEILSFSVFALLLNMGAMLAFRIDALVIGGHLTQEDVTVYALGNKVFDPFINLLLAIGLVVMPMATRLAATDETEQMRDVFLKWSKVATTLVLMLGGYLLIVGPRFLEWWLRDEYRETSGLVLQVLMVSFLAFLPLRGVALPVLMGVGRPRGPAFGLLAMGLVNLAISIALVRPYGVIGVALGTAIPNLLFAAWFAARACRDVGVPLAGFLAYAAVRPALGALPAAGVLLALELTVGIAGFRALFLAGLAFLAVFLAAQILYVWRGDRYFDLHRMVMRRLGR